MLWSVLINIVISNPEKGVKSDVTKFVTILCYSEEERKGVTARNCRRTL